MKKLIKNEYLFSVVTKIVMVFIAFFHSIVIARFLGPDLKGTHATIYSIISIGSILINMCCYQAYPYYRKKYGYTNYHDKFMSFLVVYHIIFIVIAIIISACIYNFNKITSFSIILIPIDGFATALGYICLVEHPKSRNLVLMFVDLFDTLFVTMLLFITKASENFVFLIFLIPFLLKIFYFIYKEKFKITKYSINKEFLYEIFKFSFFPMISMLLTILNYKIDILMLKSNSIISMSQIGIYSIGVALADKVVYIPDAVKEILLSKLAKGKGKNEVAMTMRFCFPISLSFTVLLILVGEKFIDFIYGSEYTGAYMVTLICVLGTSMMVFFKMISQYNNVNGKQIVNVYLLLGTVISNVILNIIMIPKLNIVGAALASLISYVICAIAFIIYFNKITNIPVRNMVFPTKDDIKQIIKISKKEKESN